MNNYKKFFILVTFLLTILIIFNYLINIQEKNYYVITQKLKDEKKQITDLEFFKSTNQTNLVLKNLFKKKKIKKTENQQEQFSLEYLNLIFDNRCKSREIFISLNYRSDVSQYNFSRDLLINLSNNKNENQIFFPIYYYENNNQKGYFYSITILNDDMICLKKILKIINTENIPIKSFTSLIVNKPINKINNQNLLIEKKIGISKKSLKKIEKNHTFYSLKNLKTLKIHPELILLNPHWKYNYHIYNDSLNNLNLPKKKYSSHIINKKNFKDIKFDKNNIFFTEGYLFNGKFKIEIFNKKKKIKSFLINQKGYFNIIFKIPEDDKYQIKFLNFTNTYEYTEHNFILNKIGVYKIIK